MLRPLAERQHLFVGHENDYLACRLLAVAGESAVSIEVCDRQKEVFLTVWSNDAG